MRSTIRLTSDSDSATERARRVATATEEVMEHVSELFPSSGGYHHRVRERCARWAWRGARNDDEALAALSSVERACACRRAIRVSKGLTWGLVVEVQTTDLDVSGCELVSLSESRLGGYLVIVGFIIGLLLALAYWLIVGAASSSGFLGFKLTMLIGLGVGGVLAFAGWLASRPLQQLKPDRLKEVHTDSARRLESALA